MKKSILIILTFIGLANYTNGQNCLKFYENYYSSIDTTDRPVFKFAEKMPEILNGEYIMKTAHQSQLFDSLQCCPIKVWIGLVVESDSTLTNIQVCTKMMFCDDNVINVEAEKFNQRIARILDDIKSAPAELNGKKVAITCIIPIHFECRDWKY